MDWTGSKFLYQCNGTVSMVGAATTGIGVYLNTNSYINAVDGVRWGNYSSTNGVYMGGSFIYKCR
jgi:hypothetical protein